MVYGAIVAESGGMLGKRLYLVWNYGKAQLVLGGLFNLALAAALASSFSAQLAVDALIIKVVMTAVIYYLVSQFSKKDGIFFYINLGFSRRKLDLTVIAIDFSFYVLLSIIAALIA